MSKCQRCESDRLFSVGGKSSDCNSWNFQGREGEGYIPRVPNLGGGDYYDLEVCLECGQLQGKWPQPTPEELILEDDQCAKCGEVLSDEEVDLELTICSDCEADPDGDYE